MKNINTTQKHWITIQIYFKTNAQLNKTIIFLRCINKNMQIVNLSSDFCIYAFLLIHFKLKNLSDQLFDINWAICSDRHSFEFLKI